MKDTKIFYKNMIPQYKHTLTDVLTDAVAVKQIKELLVKIFAHLGLKKIDSDIFIKKIITTGQVAKTDLEIEQRLKKIMKISELNHLISKGLIKRTDQVFSQISKYVEGKNILDVGAGDGLVSKAIKEKLHKKITLLDVINFNTTNLPLTIYHGTDFPYLNNEFDTSLGLTMLHHCNEPEKVLNEMIRVSKKRLILLDVSCKPFWIGFIIVFYIIMSIVHTTSILLLAGEKF